MKRFFVFITVLCIVFLTANSTSLWNKSSNDKFKSLYSDNKAYKVGDILTILIYESVSLTQDDATSDKKKGLITSTVSLVKSISNIDLSKFIPLGGSEDTSPQNKTANTAKSNITAKVAAIITDVDDNGNLVVEGKREVKMGQDRREMIIQGMVRPSDVTPDNTIDSYKIANAKLWYNGDVVFQQDPSEESWIGFILSGLSGVLF